MKRTAIWAVNSALDAVTTTVFIVPASLVLIALAFNLFAADTEKDSRALVRKGDCSIPSVAIGSLNTEVVHSGTVRLETDVCLLDFLPGTWAPRRQGAFNCEVAAYGLLGTTRMIREPGKLGIQIGEIQTCFVRHTGSIPPWSNRAS